MNQVIEIMMILLYFLLFAWIIQKSRFFKSCSLPKYFLLSVFTIKVLAGIAMAFIYTHYYPIRAEADIFKYFDDSKIMYDSLKENPEDFFRMISGMYGGKDYYYMHTYYYEMNNWYKEYEGETFNDTHTIIRFNAVARIFSFGIYQVHTIFVCFLVMIGLVFMYKSFENHFTGKKLLLAIALFLLPSVVFWGSGVLKEALLLFAMGIFIYCVFELIKINFKWYIFAGIGFSFFLLIFLKIYALLILLPAIAAYAINRSRQIKFPVISYLICFVLALVIALNFTLLKENFDVLRILATKQQDFINHARELNSNSLIDISPLEPTLISFMRNSPIALFNTFTRPYIFESGNPLMILAGIENLGMALLLILAVYRRDRISPENKNLFYFLIFYAMIMFILIGLVAPVTGAMVRYKIPALGMMAAAFILTGNWKKLLNNHPKLIKLLKIGE